MLMRSPLARDRRQPVVPGLVGPVRRHHAAVMALLFARIVLDGEAVAHCPKGLPDFNAASLGRSLALRMELAGCACVGSVYRSQTPGGPSCER
jgi:hypothetical protein